MPNPEPHVLPRAQQVWLVRDRAARGPAQKPLMLWFWSGGERPPAGVPWDGADLFGPYMNMAVMETVSERNGWEIMPLAKAAKAGGA